MRRGKRNQNLMRETARKWRVATGQVSVNSSTKALLFRDCCICLISFGGMFHNQGKSAKNVRNR